MAVGTYQISDAQTELTGMMHGTTLNQITNLPGVFNRAARTVLSDVDPQETKVVAQFGKVYDGVFDYALPTDVKGNKIIDMYPQANRDLGDVYAQRYNQDFDVWKGTTLVPMLTTLYNTGVRSLRLSAPQLVTGIQLNAADGVASNGTFTALSNTSNLRSSNLYFVNGAASSLIFDVSGGTTCGVENATQTAVDLTNHNNNGDLFFWVYLPTASAFTSIQLRWGSSASAYWQNSTTTDVLGNAWVNGWNLIKIPWSTASTTGSPNQASISYIRVQLTYDGNAQSGVGVNLLWSRLGVIHNIEYYSNCLFRSSAGAFKEKTTDATDYLNLDTDGFNLFLFAAGVEAVQQMQGIEGLFFDSPYFENRYTDALEKYRVKYKSEITKPTSTYYQKPSGSYRRRWGGNSRTP